MYGNSLIVEEIKNKMDKDNLKNEPLTDANNVLATVNPLVDIGGDSSWLSYSVYFTGGSEIEIYHERKYADNRELRQMKREKFVELWRSFNGC